MISILQNNVKYCRGFETRLPSATLITSNAVFSFAVTSAFSVDAVLSAFSRDLVSGARTRFIKRKKPRRRTNERGDMERQSRERRLHRRQGRVHRRQGARRNCLRYYTPPCVRRTYIAPEFLPPIQPSSSADGENFAFASRDCVRTMATKQ